VNESAQQVAFADKILLNKVDAASPEKIAQAMEAVRSVNSFVPVTKCSISKAPAAVPLDELLHIDAFDLTKMLDGKDIDLSVCGAVVEGAGVEAGHGEGHGGGHGHDECADDDCDDHGHGGHGGGGHDGGHDAHGGGHEGGHGHSVAFRHDTGIGSFVCELTDAPICVTKFNHWMHELLEHSENLYRFKGIMAMKDPHGDKVMKRVLQGVHDMVDMDAGDEWPADQPIKSQVVLIGRQLDRARWTSEFKLLGA
ncbi:unnamed protein product, partial [Polarella glacialis]